jgi:hypothetical protein
LGCREATAQKILGRINAYAGNTIEPNTHCRGRVFTGSMAPYGPYYSMRPFLQPSRSTAAKIFGRINAGGSPAFPGLFAGKHPATASTPCSRHKKTPPKQGFFGFGVTA